MSNIDINDINTVVAILSGLLSIISVLFSLLKNTLKANNDSANMIKRTKFNKEKKLVENYFQTLTYEEILSIEKDPTKLDNRIQDILENATKASSIGNTLDSIMRELTREDRYKLINTLSKKIGADTSQKRTTRLLLSLLTNYLFYLSRFLIYLFMYAVFIYIIVLPFWLIIIITMSLYNKISTPLFIIIIFSLVICLSSFAKKD